MRYRFFIPERPLTSEEVNEKIERMMQQMISRSNSISLGKLSITPMSADEMNQKIENLMDKIFMEVENTKNCFSNN